MANRLAAENSPYLLQHSENPVAWYPWGGEALEKARREDRPIFLSIGYAACHWCHVMAHESFEDPRIAALMNENFVNIKVDREERPDLDSIYMEAVVAMTGQGGWPMSVFLTPDGRPFYGGTYFPPVRRYGMPSFQEVLQAIAQAWRQDRDRLFKAGDQITEHLRSSQGVGASSQPLDGARLDQAALTLGQAYDWQHGGWGQAPKFPQPMAVEFLLRRASRADQFAKDMAVNALRAMSRGGMFDVVGGGFARYSTDDRWLVPHFEKMLYDNAQLGRAYLHGYLLTQEEEFRRVSEETLDFIVRELMAHDDSGALIHGGIFSSLDADSEGEEGKFYVWTPDEIRAALADPGDTDFLLAAYGVTEEGNFEGKNVLQRALSNHELAARFQIEASQVAPRLQALHARLLAFRAQRVRPGTDDKVLVAWNALALSAFAQAARYLGRPDYLEIARQNADFLITELNPKDRLLRSWRNGQARHNAYLEDYAALILGLLDLYQSDPDTWWFRSAVDLADEMVSHYKDPAWGFFDTRDDQGPLLTRPKDLQDNATPSGGSLAAMALLQVSAFTARGDWRDMAEEMLRSISSPAIRYPTAFSNWLCATDFAIGPVLEVALIGDPEDPRTASMNAQIWANYHPNLILAASPFPPSDNAPPLVQERPLVTDGPTAYVCQQFICLRPVNTPEDLRAQLYD